MFKVWCTWLDVILHAYVTLTIQFWSFNSCKWLGWRQTMTGTWEWWTIKSLTLPVMVRRTLPTPRQPQTMRSAFSWRAADTISSPGLPTPVFTVPVSWRRNTRRGIYSINTRILYNELNVSSNYIFWYFPSIFSGKYRFFHWTKKVALKFKVQDLPVLKLNCDVKSVHK